MLIYVVIYSCCSSAMIHSYQETESAFIACLFFVLIFSCRLMVLVNKTIRRGQERRRWWSLNLIKCTSVFQHVAIFVNPIFDVLDHLEFQHISCLIVIITSTFHWPSSADLEFPIKQLNLARHFLPTLLLEVALNLWKLNFIQAGYLFSLGYMGDSRIRFIILYCFV